MLKRIIAYVTADPNGDKITHTHTQVCIEPRSSALNMTLPASAAERRRLQNMSTDSCMRCVSTQQQTSRTPLLLLIDGTDRRTD